MGNVRMLVESVHKGCARLIVVSPEQLEYGQASLQLSEENMEQFEEGTVYDVTFEVSEDQSPGTPERPTRPERPERPDRPTGPERPTDPLPGVPRPNQDLPVPPTGGDVVPPPIINPPIAGEGSAQPKIGTKIVTPPNPKK